MGMLKIWTVAAGLLFLVGCSPRPEPEAQLPPPKTVFDPLTRDLSRAREVQQTVNQNSDGTRKAVDAQERGDSTP